MLVKFQNVVCLPPSGIPGSIFPWICWAIWMARNQLIFENRLTSPAETATKGLALVREWNLAQSPGGKQQNNNSKVYQNHQLSDRTICFTNSSWDKSTKRSGLAWIFRNTHTNIYQKEAKIRDFVSSPLKAEAMAIRSALQSAVSLGISSIQVRSDSLTLIKAITNKQLQKEIFGILSDIHCLCSLFVSINFIFVPQKLSCCIKAHKLIFGLALFFN